MSLISKIGDGVVGSVLFEWKIEDFFSLSDKLGDHYTSPVFSFDNSQWYLDVYPGGVKSNSSPQWVSLFLYGKDLVLPKTVFYTFGIKILDRVEEKEELESNFNKKSPSWGDYKFWSRTELRNRKSTLLPNDALTITCDLRSKNISCSDTGEKKVLKSLLNMLKSGEDSDVVIKVQGKEFPAHRGILRARSPVFRSMFAHNMSESQSNVVDIKDGDPEFFPDFLTHIYSGSSEQISAENVYSLYALADKYDVRELKGACAKFMKRNITVASFCNVLSMAKKYQDEELEEGATNFFCDNSVEIVKSKDWLNFQMENLAVGNELFLKALSK